MAGFGWIGILMFVVGRIRLARRLRRLHAMRQDASQTRVVEKNQEIAEAPFFFFSGAYWGIMFLVFGGVIFIIHPQPKKVQAAESPAVSANPEPKSKPRLPRPGPMI
jgi:hypothetical protein